MDRRQSIRVLLGALFVETIAKITFAQSSISSASSANPVNTELVKKLTLLLAQAKSGQLRSSSGVSFNDKGEVNLWSEMSCQEDAVRVIAELERLKQLNQKAIDEENTRHKS